MEKINMLDWPRKEHFDFFSGMSHPFYSVTFSLDVTNLYRCVKERGVSFYYALIYLCTKAINHVEAFRYVLRSGELYLLDQRHPSFTDLKKGEELFHIVTIPLEGDMTDFCRAAKQASMAQTRFINPSAETDALIYFTCLPWFDLTALTNERDFHPDDAVPRISWGKYVERDGRKQLHMAIELNHRFADGLHVGRFYEILSDLMDHC